MDVEELRNELQIDGYHEIYTCEDAPGTIYPLHSHAQTKLIILKGSITFIFGEKNIFLEAGDSFIVPADTEHSAVVGSEGGSYLVGEM